MNGLPVVESESVQLGRGTAHYVSKRLGGRDLIVISYSVAPELLVHTVPDPSWVVFVMSLNPGSRFVFNGRPSDAWDLCLSTGGEGYMSAGRDRQMVVVVVRRKRLSAACAALAGVAPDDIALRDLALVPVREACWRLRRVLVGVVSPPGDGAPPLAPATMTDAIENDLISMLAAQVLPSVRRVANAKPFRLDALRVVRQASAVTKTTAAPSLAELCAAAGVGQRWLHKCFVEVLGVSPYRFVRLARLSRAREQLVAAAGNPVLVKSVSLSHGYRLSGRFAAEYRAVFGENPAETLRGRQVG